MTFVSKFFRSNLKKAADQIGIKRAHPAGDAAKIEAGLRERLAADPDATALLEQMLATHEKTLYEAQLWPHVRQYNHDIAAVLGHACAASPYFLHTSWSFDTPVGSIHNIRLAEVFVAFEESLIEDIHTRNVPGAIVEFGIFEGAMLSKLLEKAEKLGMNRQFYGFDSFEGLSEPSKTNDFDAWQKGQYAAPFDRVANYLRLSERPHLKLIKGWVEDSLKTPEALAIDPIAYARIDVDIYDPTVDCLNYLTNRLADGAILAFDDWAYSSEKGESKAFFEWVPKVPHLRFEWLGQCSSRFYFRVHKR